VLSSRQLCSPREEPCCVALATAAQQRRCQGGSVGRRTRRRAQVPEPSSLSSLSQTTLTQSYCCMVPITMGQSSKTCLVSWRRRQKKAGVEGHAGIKYVFPHSLQNDDGENFWYDYDAEDDAEEMQCDNDMINLEQWETQNKRIAQVVAAEVAKLGDPSKVILGGNSAGGGLAINVAMHRLEKALGGLICLRTCPMRHTLDSKAPEPVNGEPNGSALMSTRAKGMPVMVYQAGQDDTYVPLLQARNYAFIEAAGFGVEYKVKPNGTHEEDDPDENPQVAVWIVKTLFKKLAFRDAVVPPGSIFALANKK